jgi:gamma-glutamyltranspeptidase/glutathione hydrolase
MGLFKRYGGVARCAWRVGLVCGLVASIGCGDDGAVDDDGSSSSSSGTGGGAPLSWTEESGKQALGSDGMVVSSHPAAARVGADILKSGGNAVDAAIAMQFSLNVVEPMMSGIGGGCFVVVYQADSGEVQVVNARERAPAGATPGMFLDAGGNPVTFSQRVTLGAAIGVPGTVKAMDMAHQRWGTLGWAELIAPAIDLATNGHPVGGRLASSISGSFGKLDDAAKAVFAPGGMPLGADATLFQPELAATLSSIAEGGVDAFYAGPIAEALAGTVQSFGGSMTAADLSSYAQGGAEIVQPVEVTIDGVTIRSVPPPSSGGILVGQILGMLHERDMASYDKDSIERHHLQTEASRLAYADRFAYIGDPRFVTVPQAGMLDPAYIAGRAGLIDLSAAIVNPQAGTPASGSAFGPTPDWKAAADNPFGHTTHFTVADRWGNVVALTSTIEQVFGSGHMVPSHGFMLNNELTDFSATPGGPNQPDAGKQPVSSMTPLIAFENGEPVFTLGAAGGLTIITSVFQTLQNHTVYGMDVLAAVEEPRTFGALYPDIYWEAGVPQAVRDGLSALGHSVASTGDSLSNLQAIAVGPTGYHGAADSSADDGSAIGLSVVE